MHNTTPEMRIAKLYDDVRRQREDLAEMSEVLCDHSELLLTLGRNYRTVEMVALIALSISASMIVLIALGVIPPC